MSVSLKNDVEVVKIKKIYDKQVFENVQRSLFVHPSLHVSRKLLSISIIPTASVMVHRLTSGSSKIFTAVMMKYNTYEKHKTWPITMLILQRSVKRINKSVFPRI